jgi:putative N6-adenine-specific DNA methylase
MERHQIFLVAIPGLEAPLRREALACGFHNPRAVRGGVIFEGGWPHVWRANLFLRGAVRVLVRVGVFKAHHLAQIGPETRRLPWGALIARGTPVRVTASCAKSRISHAGAVAERVSAALVDGAGVVPSEEESALGVVVRVEKDHVTLSLDTSGAPLHRRGHKQAVAKAPLRETMAALFLQEMGFDGTQAVLDPLCGSGTIPIEAAEIALGLLPGRSRRFGFEHLRSFDAAAIAALKEVPLKGPHVRFHGSDRDAGAIASAEGNAARAGVGAFTHLTCQALSHAQPPEGPPGLLLTNPPYGARIGDRRALFALYGALGKIVTERFAGWRFGMVTSDAGLARTTGLALTAGPSVHFGGLTVRLYQA